MKLFLSILTTALAVTLSACGLTTATGKIIEVGLSGTLLGKLYAGSLAGSKDGLTLYQFASDTKGGTTSACVAACATTWPPLTVTAATQLVAGTGASKALATITRTDGSLQVTYDGYPLYFYSGDSLTGQTNGATVGGWSLVAK